MAAVRWCDHHTHEWERGKGSWHKSIHKCTKQSIYTGHAKDGCWLERWCYNDPNKNLWPRKCPKPPQLHDQKLSNLWKTAKTLEAEGYIRIWHQCRTKTKPHTEILQGWTSSKHNDFVYVATMCTKVLEKNDKCMLPLLSGKGFRVTGMARTGCPFYKQIDTIPCNQAVSSFAVLLESSVASPLAAD